MLRLLAVVLTPVFVMGCGPGTQTFPLEIEGQKAKASFGPIEKCARELGHDAEVKADSVTVPVTPERRVAFRFVDGAKNLSMVTSVDSDGDRGALPALKSLGDAIWDCASGAGTAPSGSASASPSASPTATPSASPTATPTAMPSAAPSAAPATTGGPSADPSAAPPPPAPTP